MKTYHKPKLTKHAQLKNITFSREEKSGYHKEHTVEQGKSLWWDVRDDKTQAKLA